VAPATSRRACSELIKIKGIEGPVRQLAVRNIGREQPTLLITNDLTATTKQLFAR
jgi:hypothetical protein